MKRYSIIQSSLLGRLGNQLFIYAAARAMALENDCGLELSEESIKPHNISCRLDCFNLSSDVKIVLNRHFSISQRIGFLIYLCLCRHKHITQVYEIEKRYNCFFSKFRLFLNQEGYVAPMKFKRGDMYAFGYFQSEKYFSKYEDVIRKEFTFRTDIFSEDTMKIGRQIHDDPKSVCIHIRRGDYLNDPVFCVCSNDYYYEAIEQISKEVTNASYYVFSDNIDDVKGLFSRYRDLHFIFIDSGFTDQESLYLGTCCRHFIMTNSTFSWWMQYLSDNVHKIVYAPSKWYGVERPCDIYQDNWRLITV